MHGYSICELYVKQTTSRKFCTWTDCWKQLLKLDFVKKRPAQAVRWLSICELYQDIFIFCKVMVSFKWILRNKRDVFFFEHKKKIQKRGVIALSTIHILNER